MAPRYLLDTNICYLYPARAPAAGARAVGPATAGQRGLVADNRREFERVDGLKLENWVQ
jgi:predicted nucleic acid-binding protein